ncbi:hypothetical protein CROQUDRAFT_105958 [Cronartium quercuum f. sp. fusiforme G11]|uniref:Uncharacterized protein n=1 Tax=Cronartium quercuum f. sp. fusiforme G11 TaxID=708437 RepID=A0A9P6NQ84_9BASI|nr:hypothetical protein CROQUDRAFT_105958 [Cronartium quercuum f. sp. fusiforme G11]
MAYSGHIHAGSIGFHRFFGSISISDLFESRTPSSSSVSTARGCESGLKNAVFGGQEDF